MHPALLNSETAINAYADAYNVHSAAPAAQDQMESKHREILTSRKALLDEIEQNPDLASDSKYRTRLNALVADLEMTEAALRGLKARADENLKVVRRLNSHMFTAFPGDHFSGLWRRYIHKHETELLDLLRSWGPGDEGANFGFNPQQLLPWVRGWCIGSSHQQKMEAYNDDRLPPPDVLQAALDFLDAEFKTCPPPDVADEVPESAPAEEQAAA